MIVDKNLELIARYFRDEMTIKEKEGFKQKLAKDETLKAMFEEEKMLFAIFSEENRQEEEKTLYTKLFASQDTNNLKNAIAKASKEYHKKTKFQVRQRKMIYTWSAVAAVVLLFVTLNFYQRNNNSLDSIYNEAYTKTSLPQVISRSNDKEDLHNIPVLFGQQKYNNILKVLNETSLRSATAYIYKGMSYLALGKEENALAVFEKFTKTDLIDAPKGHWFKLLVYLKANKKQNAKKEAQYIVKNKLYNYKEAKKVLAALD